MSGIPVYTQSPINAGQPTGVTPRTAAPLQPSTSSTASTTTTAGAETSYPQARPGAAPSIPTAAASRYTPLQPTHTSTAEDDAPPPPQPNAFPIPSHKNNPPPPKAGETYEPPQQTATPTYAYQPPQMGIPPPTAAIGSRNPPSSTATSNTPSSSYPALISSAEIGDPRRSLEHPPSYQQNSYASDLTPNQRMARETQSSTFGNASSYDDHHEQDSMWNTAKSWAQQAGQKLQAVEEDVWKKINK